MKPIIPFALLGALFAVGAANAQSSTTPVGYSTESLKTGQFNLIGLTLHQPVAASGTLETVTATTVTDTTADFSALVAGATYVLEIDDEASSANGAIAEVTSWTTDTLTTTPTDLAAAGAASGVSYKLRKAATIGDIFGATNAAGLQAGTTSTADIVWISTGGGNFNRYYYATAQPPFVTAGWKLIGGGNDDRANTPIVYTDGLIVERKGPTDLDLTVTGEVKTGDTIVAVTGSAFNHLGGLYPVGSTLGSSGLGAFVTPGTTSTADIVWVPDGVSSYNRYYFATAQPPFVTAGWKLIGGGNDDRAGSALAAGIILERRGASGNLLATAPASYDTL